MHLWLRTRIVLLRASATNSMLTTADPAWCSYDLPCKQNPLTPNRGVYPCFKFPSFQTTQHVIEPKSHNVRVRTSKSLSKLHQTTRIRKYEDWERRARIECRSEDHSKEYVTKDRTDHLLRLVDFWLVVKGQLRTLCVWFLAISIAVEHRCPLTEVKSPMG